MLVVMDARVSSASDRVWLEPQRPTNTQSDWYPRAIEQLDGRVIDLDNKQLRFVRSGDEAETIVAADRVLWIEPEDVSDLQAELIALFKKGEHAHSNTVATHWAIVHLVKNKHRMRVYQLSL